MIDVGIRAYEGAHESVRLPRPHMGGVFTARHERSGSRQNSVVVFGSTQTLVHRASRVHQAPIEY